MEQLRHNVQAATGTAAAAVCVVETSAAADIREGQSTGAAADIREGQSTGAAAAVREERLAGIAVDVRDGQSADAAADVSEQRTDVAANATVPAAHTPANAHSTAKAPANAPVHATEAPAANTSAMTASATNALSAADTADTLAAPDIREERSTDIAADTVPTLRYTDAAEMFGDASTAVAEPAVAVVSYGGRSNSGIFAKSIESPAAGDPVFQSLLLATLIVCIAVSTRYKREIASLTGKMFGGRLSDDYAEGRRHDIIPKQFMDTSILFGIFVISLIVVRYVDAWLPERVQAIGGDFVPFAVLRVLGVTALCIAYQYAALKFIGFISRETEFIGVLFHIKRAAFAVSTVIIAPVFVLAALSVGRSAEVWMLVLAGICAVLVLLFVKETLVLFIGKKVPFLHWILYLCAVEAFPLTLVCASIARCQ